MECKCEICNAVLAENECVKHDNNYYCEDCFDNNYDYCEGCEKYYLKEDIIETANGDKYCYDCINDEHFQCSCCHEYYNDDEEIYFDNKSYCSECADEELFVCYECDNYSYKHDAIETANGDLICNDCYCEDYVTCYICNDVIRYDDSNYHDEEYYCEYCYEHEIASLGIHDYCFKPDDYIFHSEDDEDKNHKNTLFVGIELEIQGDNKKSFCQTVYSNYDDDTIYMKEDGSLNSHGVELVSNPMSIKYILNNHEWKDIFDLMNKYQMDDIDNCGLHFHIDRSYLNQDNISVIDYIVNNFENYLSKIGGRDFKEDTQYCRKRIKDVYSWGFNRREDNRYQAVNLTNEYTVELRFCKSTYNWDEFIERVKMIATIVEFSKKFTIKDIMKYSKDEFEILFKNMENILF